MTRTHETPEYAFTDVTLTPPAGERPLTCRGLWTVPADLRFLDGHFPERTLVPAAIIMEVAQAFIRVAAEDPQWQVAWTKHCKFKAPMQPGETFQVAAAARKPGAWTVSFSPAAGGDWVAELDLGRTGSV